MGGMAPVYGRDPQPPHSAKFNSQRDNPPLSPQLVSEIEKVYGCDVELGIWGRFKCSIRPALERPQYIAGSQPHFSRRPEVTRMRSDHHHLAW